VALGVTPLVVPHAGFDLVYYEQEALPGFIALDWVIVEICSDPVCAVSPIVVFNWGGGVTANTNVSGFPENDNELIPMSALWGTPPYQTGVAIDVDGLAPAGTYRWVRLTSPFGGDDDGSEVDAIEVLP
jgi:hypothetical protein